MEKDMRSWGSLDAGVGDPASRFRTPIYHGIRSRRRGASNREPNVERRAVRRKLPEGPDRASAASEKETRMNSVSWRSLRRAAGCAVLAAGILGMPAHVAASLIGDSIRGCREGAGDSFPFCDTSPLTTGFQFTDVSATVADPGIEFQTANANIRADFDAISLTISAAVGPGQILTPAEWVFGDLDWGVAFDELVLLPGNTYSVDSFIFTQDTIRVLTPGQSLPPGQQIPAVLSATFQIRQSVPEPATLALFGLGLAALAGLRRHKQGKRA